jgi:hypothetical protein
MFSVGLAIFVVFLGLFSRSVERADDWHLVSDGDVRRWKEGKWKQQGEVN